MVKSQLVDEIAKEHHTWPFKDIVFAVNFLLGTMSEALVDGNRIEVRKFGSFSCRYLKPRNAHNPKSGEKVRTQGKKRARFRAAKALRERINSGHKVKPIIVSSRRARRRIEETATETEMA
jgi:integration host factor subunit beta